MKGAEGSADALEATVWAGNRKDSLQAVRDLLARELAASSGRNTAVLARELREIIRELDSLSVPEVSAVDDVAARRAKRRAASATG